MIRKLVLAGVAALACVLWLPAAAQAQSAIAGMVKDTSGAVLPGRDRRSVERRADREDPVGDDRRRRRLPHRRSAPGHLHRHLHAAGLPDLQARRRSSCRRTSRPRSTPT